MSEIQRVALHTAPRSRKEKEPPARSVRLNVELGASNEDQYPEISYRDLIAAHLRKGRTENGKRAGPASGAAAAGAGDPFSDNEDDVARLAKQFEQKYGSLSTYGRARRTRRDEYADIGAGYDESDSFIDNTDGYDEMCPPGYDTIHGGFYINCGSLEFKNVLEESRAESDGGPTAGPRTNKRRISSSSSEESSSESSSDSESGADGSKERVLNGEREAARRSKKKTDSKKKGKKRRTDASSAATSGKHTSDDNGQVENESADSRTSHTEDSLTSKPAPSSENVVTSDSSREVSDAVKPECKFPPVVALVLDEMAACIARLKQETGAKPVDVDTRTDPYVLRLEQALGACNAEVRCRRAAWVAAARVLSAPRTRLLHRARALAAQPPRAPPAHNAAPVAAARVPDARVGGGVAPEPMETDVAAEVLLTPEQREQKISDILDRLKTMIDAKKPEMIQTYKAECERVQEANKKIAAANALAAAACEGTRLAERRLPKRRYPWCGRMRAQLARLVALCGGGGGAGGGGDEAAARLLAHRVLPMFPPGFVRLPTLLRQASLNKDMKVTEIKKQRIPIPGHVVMNDSPLPQPTANPIPVVAKPTAERTHEVACGTSEAIKLNGKPSKPPSLDNAGSSIQKTTFNSIFNSFTLAQSTDMFLEKSKVDRDDPRSKDTISVEKLPEPIKISPDKLTKTDDKFVPPNSIGSITITPVTQAQKFDPRHQASKLANNTVTITAGPPKPSLVEPSIRVKSPAEIMKAAAIIAKDDKPPKSKPEQKLCNPPHIKLPEVRSQSPLRIDVSHPRKDAPSKPHSPSNLKPANGDSKGNARSENNLPRPGLIPVHHSPTFAKPAEKKTKPNDGRVVIVTDLDPLSDVLQVDDSSSDVELVEEVTTKQPDPLSVPEHPKTDQIKEPSKEPPSQSTNAQKNPESSSSKHTNRDSSRHERDRTDDRQSRWEPDVPRGKTEDCGALGRIKEDYTHKHRSPKEQSGSRSEHGRSEKSHRDGHVPSERSHGVHSDKSHRSNDHSQHSDRRKDDHSPHSGKSHRDRDKRDSGHTEKRHRSDEHRSHSDSQRRDHDASGSQWRHHSNHAEGQKRERQERPADRDHRSDRPQKSNVSAESIPSRVDYMDKSTKLPNRDTVLVHNNARTEKQAEVENDIDQVMRNLRDLQNSQEQTFISDSYGSPRNAQNQEP